MEFQPQHACERGQPAATTERLAGEVDRHAMNGRDIRAWVALAFGLVHGFGFANVLREFGLPREALGWSLFAFNVGVEIGQLFIVTLIAGGLALVRQRNQAAAQRLAVAGSIVVIAAGAYWFVERVFFA